MSGFKFYAFFLLAAASALYTLFFLGRHMAFEAAGTAIVALLHCTCMICSCIEKVGKRQ